MFSHSGPENWSENSSWFFKKEYAMFGALGDLGVHKIDLIRFLTGQEIVECFAYLGTLEKTGNVEDTASAILKLTNNIIATLDVNWITKGLEENYFVVYGEKGTMKIGQTNPNVIELYFTEPIKYTGKIELPPLFTNEDPYWKLPVIDHFAKVCKGIEKPIIAPEDGMISIKIIEKLFESFEKNGVVKIHE
jgi:predicted dehydrogenase